jgi:hypothetical protein
MTEETMVRVTDEHRMMAEREAAGIRNLTSEELENRAREIAISLHFDSICTHDDVENLVCCDCGRSFENGSDLRAARAEAQDNREPADTHDVGSEE